ncbi:MAG: ABZJ_00895 family protein [Pseudomonadota bacterium]
MSLTSRTLLNFSVYYAGAIVAITILSAILDAYLQIDAPGGLGVVPFLVAVIGAGAKLGERLDQIPSSGVLWGLAFKLTLTGIVISFVLAAGLIALFMVLAPAGLDELKGLLEIDATIIGVVVLIVALVYLLVARFVLVTGIKSGMKKRNG